MTLKRARFWITTASLLLSIEATIVQASDCDGRSLQPAGSSSVARGSGSGLASWVGLPRLGNVSSKYEGPPHGLNALPKDSNQALRWLAYQMLKVVGETGKTEELENSAVNYTLSSLGVLRRVIAKESAAPSNEAAGDNPLLRLTKTIRKIAKKNTPTAAEGGRLRTLLNAGISRVADQSSAIALGVSHQDYVRYLSFLEVVRQSDDERMTPLARLYFVVAEFLTDYEKIYADMSTATRRRDYRALNVLKYMYYDYEERAAKRIVEIVQGMRSTSYASVETPAQLTDTPHPPSGVTGSSSTPGI